MILLTSSFRQGAFIALCFILLTSCFPSKCRLWELDEVNTQCPLFNSGRLLLCSDSPTSYMEIEITRNQCGVRMYLNILFLEAPPSTEDCTRSKAVIIFDDQEEWNIYPYLFAGGQRLLFPKEDADILIQALLDGRDFKIQMGRNYLTVISDNFSELYQQLLLLPIADDKKIIDYNYSFTDN